MVPGLAKKEKGLPGKAGLLAKCYRHSAEAKSRRQAALKEIRDDMMKGNWKMRLASALVLDTGGQTDHKLSSRLESVDFEGAAKLADS